MFVKDTIVTMFMLFYKFKGFRVCLFVFEASFVKTAHLNKGSSFEQVCLDRADSRPEEAPLWRSFHLYPDHTAGRQLHTNTFSVSVFIHGGTLIGASGVKQTQTDI